MARWVTGDRFFYGMLALGTLDLDSPWRFDPPVAMRPHSEVDFCTGPLGSLLPFDSTTRCKRLQDQLH